MTEQKNKTSNSIDSLGIGQDPLSELKEMRIWVLWRREQRDGKITKVPFAANGGKTGADAKYSGTWVTYEAALEAAERQTCAGVGFVIPKGYFFLDVDGRDQDDPYVRELLERFNSYAELSQSGNGIHIYGKITLEELPMTVKADGTQRLDPAYYMKNPTNGTELYFGGLTSRYAAFTGNAIMPIPAADCTAAVLETLEKNMRRPGVKTAEEKALAAEVKEKPKTSRALRYEPVSDDDGINSFINKLLKQKNGGKFSRLFFEGDTEGFNSASEADFSLCRMIAFRAGNRPEVVDQIFRLSRLYREKWEREDYRTTTIEKAIASCNGEFREVSVQRPYFVYDDGNGEEKVSGPLLKKYVDENMRYILVRDSGMNELMVYVYEGGVYVFHDEHMVKGRIRAFIEAYDLTLVKVSVLSEVYELLLTDSAHCVSQSALNDCIGLINFRNGLLDISAEQPRLLPHTPDVFSTIQLPLNWTGNNTPTPVFDAYMNTLCNGDKGTQRLLMEFLGAAISNIPGYKMKKALFLVGPGNTGKSQLKALAERILGPGNFVGIDLSEIESRFGSSMLYGKRLAGSSDMSYLSVDELKTFKMLTGGDNIFAERKGKHGFTFTYNGLLWFCMNRLPKFGGDDGKWVYDRIMVVECKNVIPSEKQDKDLLEKMVAERDGIIAKAVKALAEVIRKGYRFSETKEVARQRRVYRENNSTPICFYQECMCKKSEECKLDEELTVTSIYKAYVNYCKINNNGYAKPRREFEETLAAALGYESCEEMKSRKNYGIVFTEYTLTQEAREQYKPASVFY